jgi:para-aminobenzoate synthetase / 4-amino-4-deoxychorismate lyase
MKREMPTSPFVLLDDGRDAGASNARLYANPEKIVSAYTAEEVSAALQVLGNEKCDGHWAGFMGYEAGHMLEPRLAGFNAPSVLPHLWFARFADFQEIRSDEVLSWLPDAVGGWAGEPAPAISRAAYGDALATVKDLIDAGDIYQANLTFQTEVAVAGHPLAVYAGLRTRAKAGYGGVVWTGSDWLLSLSPELFFAKLGQKITTRPMKGTAVHQCDPDRDALAKETLKADPKQRAENLMIVDLLRNDLSRVALAGSVTVPQLFHIETYPTVHQMTSTITAELQAGVNAADVLKRIFPCGSITGAPKIRAMEVIQAVEAQPRGIYTGCIGRIDANGDAAFNVAIRTLHWPSGGLRATLGLGSGIVADSHFAEEWDECLAKGRFVADNRVFDLIETMRFEPDVGIALLDLHINRMSKSAQQLAFSFDRHAARNELQAATFKLTAPRKVRMLLSRRGHLAIEISALPHAPSLPVTVALVPLPVSANDFRLSHKTSDRAFYDEARTASGADEVVFVDENGQLTEGSFTSVFVDRDGVLVTPSLKGNLLPGVLRASLVESGRAIEGPVWPGDLANGFKIGNACRGLIPARLI